MATFIGKVTPRARALFSSRRFRRIGTVMLIVLAFLLILRLTVMRPPTVVVATVKRGNVAAEVEGTGTVTADALANVATKITGRVEQVFVDQGDQVHRGQILAVLDQTNWQHRVVIAQDHLAAALATAGERHREWLREKMLVVSGAVGIEESQQHQTRDIAAQSAVAAARAELGIAQYNLSLTQVRALSNGIVTQRWAVPGTVVVPGQPMFTIADTRLIYVDAYVDQDDSGVLHAGQPAAVMLRGHAGQTLRGKVLRIRPRADAETEETVAQVAFTLPPAQFQLGQWANVYIHVGTAKNALVVPQTALMPIGNNLFVWVVGAQDRLRREQVKMIARSSRAPMVAVSGALQSGDRVALMPMGLRPGEKVRPMTMKRGQSMGTM